MTQHRRWADAAIGRSACLGAMMSMLAAASCKPQEKAHSPTAERESEAVARNEGKVIVRIAGRNGTITIYEGADGPLYTMNAGDGKLVFELLAEAEIIERYPEVWRRVETYFAGREMPWAGTNLIGRGDFETRADEWP